MKLQKRITSRSNPDVQKLRLIRDGKEPLLFCEGEKLVEDLLASNLQVMNLYVTPKTEMPLKELLRKKNKLHVPVITLSNEIMDFISDVKTAPGLIAIAKRPAREPAKFQKNTLALVLDGVQLPQNLGALMRTAEAVGVTDFLVSSNSCDPYNPKAIRGSTGSVFRLRIQTGASTSDFLSDLKNNGVQTTAAHQDGKTSYTSFDWTKPTALLVGSEGQGFEGEILRNVNATVKIPMHGQVESLNVGVAAAICLFEAARQRHEPTS